MKGFRVGYWLAAYVVVGGAVGTPHAATLAAYPEKPIRLIVPFPPGGGTDILARMVAHELTKAHGWQFVFDNRPGAAGNLGLDLAAKAVADGYTMVIGQTSNLAVNPNLYAKLPYDSVRDFAPVSLISSMPVALMVWAKSPYYKLGDLIDGARRHEFVQQLRIGQFLELLEIIGRCRLVFGRRCGWCRRFPSSPSTC